MRALYISYDGMTDTLGQSQVIPYLAGLTRRGHRFDILSCEKPDRLKKHGAEIRALLDGHGIGWHPLAYHKKPPVLSTVFDLSSLHLAAARLQSANHYDVVHCRSYIAALVGQRMKERFGTRFIFDMRGFWADERVDGGLWNLSNPLYKTIYKYFKSRELGFLAAADRTVSLTHLARDEILRWKVPGKRPVEIEVIPCCADLEHFTREKVSDAEARATRQRLGLSPDDFVVVYLGSIGTWYMLPEMLQFFRVLRSRRPDARFLFVTPDAPQAVYAEAKRQGVPEKQIVVTSATRAEVPRVLATADLGFFFIKPSYSKMSSSPTKLGELLGMGIPVVMNSGVGDSDWISSRFRIGEVVRSFTEAEYERVARKLDDVLAIPAATIRLAASDYFSLAHGVELYARIYETIGKPS